MQAFDLETAVEEDQRVVLRHVTWQDFETLLTMRGDRAGVRMYYLDGEIEIMSPARMHESRKKTLARLLEVWSMEVGVELNGFGSWTLKHQPREAGAEPDECYIVGASVDADVPDLAIEVEWSRAVGLSKREIYRRLGVRELWTLESDGTLLVRVLRDGEWIERNGSVVLPNLDVEWLMSFLGIDPQSKAVIALRDAIRLERA